MWQARSAPTAPTFAHELRATRTAGSSHETRNDLALASFEPCAFLCGYSLPHNGGSHAVKAAIRHLPPRLEKPINQPTRRGGAQNLGSEQPAPALLVSPARFAEFRALVPGFARFLLPVIERSISMPFRAENRRTQLRGALKHNPNHTGRWRTAMNAAVAPKNPQVFGSVCMASGCGGNVRGLENELRMASSEPRPLLARNLACGIDPGDGSAVAHNVFGEGRGQPPEPAVASFPLDVLLVLSSRYRVPLANHSAHPKPLI